MATTWEEYELDNERIDEISEHIQSYMKELDEQPRNIQRIRLVVEELLLRLRDSSEAPRKVRVKIGREYGRHIFKLSYDGVSLDPTNAGDDSNIFLDTMGLVPTWGYRKGVNTVSLSISGRMKRGRIFRILLSLAAAFLLGWLGLLLPEGVRTTIDESLLHPILKAFLGLLSTFAGIMIALTISSGVIGVGDSAVLSKIGKKVILRFVLLSFLSSFFAMAVVYPFVNFASGANEMDFQFREILQMFFDILPSNPIDPFLNGNSLQIIVIGLFVGVGLLALGERTKGIRDLVQEGTALSQWLTSSVCSLVPIFVFVALLRQIWGGGVSILTKLWWPLLLVICVTTSWAVIVLLYVSFRNRCSPILILKKLLPIALVGLSTGSSMVCFTMSVETCEKKLGIESSYVKFAYPMGNVMFMQGTVMYLTVIAMVFAETYGVQVNLTWLVTTIVTASLLAIAVPPVPGAGMMLYTILFTQLGIPEAAFLMAAAMEIVMDFFDTGANLFTLLLEMIGGARNANRLDKSVLLKGESK